MDRYIGIDVHKASKHAYPRRGISRQSVGLRQDPQGPFPRRCQPLSRASAARSTRPSANNTKSAPGGTRSAPSPGSLPCA
jgi:hypothetical protein